MNNWWLVIQAPSGRYAWSLGDPDPDSRDDLVVRAKALLDMPGGDEWVSKPHLGWHCLLAPGETELPQGKPHPAVGAVVRDVAELRALPVAKVHAWRDADTTARAQARIDGARAMFNELSEDEKALLRAHLGPG
jgi:hypothetical protein